MTASAPGTGHRYTSVRPSRGLTGLLIVLTGLVGWSIHDFVVPTSSQGEPGAAVPSEATIAWPEEVYVPTGEYLDFADRPAIRSGENVRTDASGLPEVLEPGGWSHNPVTIAQAGLQDHALFLRTNQPRSRDRAIAAAEWLVEEQETSGAWNFDFSWHVGGHGESLKPPWASSLAQGQAISLLVRAHDLTGERRFLRAAGNAVGPLKRRSGEGGLRTEVLGLTVFEEYPTRTPSVVLDGHLMTLLGLYDLARHDRRANELWQGGMEDLPQLLPLYDVGGHPAYHLAHVTRGPRPVEPASPLYRRLDAVVLNALHDAAPHPALSYFRDLWRSPQAP